MIDSDALDQLRSVDPYQTDGASESQPASGFNTLFEEITMIEVDDKPTDETSEKTPWWESRMVFGGAACLLAGLTAAAVLTTFRSPSEPISAQETVLRATETAAEHLSGVTTVEGNFAAYPYLELPKEEHEQTQPENWHFAIRYDGDDYETVADDELIALSVDGQHYTPVLAESGDSTETDQPSRYLVEPADLTIGPPFGPMTPNELLPLLRASDNFTKTASEGQTVTYQATAPVEELQPDDLPIFVVMAVEQESGINLPENVTLQAVVEDKTLVKLVVALEGDTPDGYIDGSTSVTYTELGEPQGLQPPSPDQTITHDQLDEEMLQMQVDEGTLTVEEKEKMLRYDAALRALTERRPGLCESFVGLGARVNNGPVIGDEFDEELKLQEAVSDMQRIDWHLCLIEAGESEASEEIRRNEPTFDIPQPTEISEASALLEELYRSQPQLCRTERFIVADGITLGDGDPIEDPQQYKEAFAAEKARHLQAIETYVACLKDADETAAAEAVTAFWVR